MELVHSKQKTDKVRPCGHPEVGIHTDEEEEEEEYDEVELVYSEHNKLEV